MDAYIVMSKGQNKSVSFEIEGTNSAGDLGAAASISFQHRNVFKGSETFTMKVRGAYEAITGLGQDYVNDNYTEYGVESSLNFPEFMFPFLSSDFKRKIKATSEVGLKFTSQVRPDFLVCLHQRPGVIDGVIENIYSTALIWRILIMYICQANARFSRVFR